MLYAMVVKNINLSFVQGGGGLHFVLYLISHPMPDDLTIVETSSLVWFFLIIKERAYMSGDAYLAPLHKYFVNRGSLI